MGRKGVRRGAEHDVERLLDELHTTAPSGFVARRAELAAAAEADGRPKDARRIRAARRPTLAAWAANLLLRSQPQESRRFLELGRALREAYRTLDADGIKELSGQRRNVVSALSRQAAELARAAGHRLSDAARQDVESTLRAVLADEDAADLWAAGRLERALTPPADFPPADPSAARTPRKPAEAAPPPSSSQAEDELAERRRQRQAQLGEARRAVRAADRRLGELRAEQADADGALRQAHDRHEEAGRRLSAAEEQLRQAREDLERADQEEKEAGQRRRAAAAAAARADRAARDAAREVERLAGPAR
ncbi:hypothetical protein [Streptomyces sp. NPDC050263]|uniref:hypothetical protein n=1 Tax=Streptomyces sp. NPDC050263 TaxID=3155037 RepID=UPI003447E53A